jgi:hypothetical protein
MSETAIETGGHNQGCFSFIAARFAAAAANWPNELRN